MKQISAYIKLVRLNNLLMIALTQYLVRYCVIVPIFEIYDALLFLNDFQFFLLVVSSVLIAAAGYIINDYFDTGIDSINKPFKVVIGNIISRKHAMAFYFVCNFISIAIGIYLGIEVGNYKLGYLHFFVASLLWFYATSFKKVLAVGNIIVSFLAAFVLLIICFYEPMFYKAMSNSTIQASGTTLLIVFVYAGFAFLISIAREIIKDIEDMQGDADYGCKTLPIVMGVKFSKVIIGFLLTIIFVFIIYLQLQQYAANQFLPFFYLLILIQMPLAVIVFLLYKAVRESQFRRLSLFLKGIMIMGILSMLFFYFLI